MGGEGRDAPAGDGSGGQARQLLLGHRPPAPERKSRHPRSLGGELQAAGCGQAKARYLADDGGEPLFAQTLLHGGENISLAEGLSIDDAIRVQAGIHEAGSEQVASVEAPQHRAFEPGSNAGREEGCCPSELGGGTGFDHFMQRSKDKTTLRQATIDGSKGEGQGAAGVTPALQALDLVPQLGKHRLSPGTHAPCPTCPSFQDVPSMFSFASESI